MGGHYTDPELVQGISITISYKEEATDHGQGQAEALFYRRLQSIHRQHTKTFTPGPQNEPPTNKDHH